jgi:hypothetical protein
MDDLFDCLVQGFAREEIKGSLVIILSLLIFQASQTNKF